MIFWRMFLSGCKGFLLGFLHLLPVMKKNLAAAHWKSIEKYKKVDSGDIIYYLSIFLSEQALPWVIYIFWNKNHFTMLQFENCRFGSANKIVNKCVTSFNHFKPFFHENVCNAHWAFYFFQSRVRKKYRNVRNSHFLQSNSFNV